jgi:membrane AbrB-like protein
MKIVTLAIAACGGFIFHLINLPLAWLLGAMFSVAICCSIIKELTIPKPWRSGATAILGTVVGALVTVDIFSLLLTYAPSIAIMLGCQLLLTGAGIWFFLQRTSTDRLSAFFASFPGAISQITALSLEHKCDARMIALNHTSRLFIVIAFIPLAIAVISGDFETKEIDSNTPTDSLIGYIWPILVATLGYLIGKRFISITPILYGPMILAALLSVTGLLPEANIGEWLIAIAQIIIGASVGLRLKNIKPSEWKNMTSIHVPYALMLLVFTLVASWSVHVFLGIPLNASLLIMAPGGLSEMVLIAYALDIDPVMVTSHHVIRSLFSLFLIPWVMNFWIKSKELQSQEG